MNLFDLEEKKVKTVRVLVYPNITFQKDLEKDSYIQVIKNQIKLLNDSYTQNLKRIRRQCDLIGLLIL